MLIHSPATAIEALGKVFQRVGVVQIPGQLGAGARARTRRARNLKYAHEVKTANGRQIVLATDMYMGLGEAAKRLGVSAWTLRNWDRAGKLKPTRHPINGHRLYRHEELEAVLAEARGGPDGPLTPAGDWGQTSASDHFVQFYENDEFLIESASGFVAAALRNGGSSVVALTPKHLSALNGKLVAIGIDVAESTVSWRMHQVRRRLAGRTGDGV